MDNQIWIRYLRKKGMLIKGLENLKHNNKEIKEFKDLLSRLKKSMMATGVIPKEVLKERLKIFRKKAETAIRKNLKVKPDTLCTFGSLGLMSVENLVNTFVGKELEEDLLRNENTGVENNDCK